jgi:hypothetical protein
MMEVLGLRCSLQEAERMGVALRDQILLLPLHSGTCWAPEAGGGLKDEPDVDVAVADRLLRPLVGRPLDYYAFARDTPKGAARPLVAGRACARACGCVRLGAVPALSFSCMSNSHCRQGHYLHVVCCVGYARQTPSNG